MTSCHLAAAFSALLADLWLTLGIIAAGGVSMSYLLYLQDRFNTFYEKRLGVWRRTNTELVIGEQSASLSYLGKVRQMQLPNVSYSSEFLLVLSFFPEAEVEKGAGRAVNLVLWPDSLARRENRRLRRYLRFDLPCKLG